MPLSPDCILPHQVPDIPLLRPATLTLTIFLLPIHVFVLKLKQRIISPTSLFLNNTIDSDVALAYLTTATVTIAVVDMIMSLVIGHENMKRILRPLTIVHEEEFNENGKA